MIRQRTLRTLNPQPSTAYATIVPGKWTKKYDRTHFLTDSKMHSPDDYAQSVDRRIRTDATISDNGATLPHEPGHSIDPRPGDQTPPLPPTPAFPFVVIGIGASAGGLESLAEFFETMSSDSNAAFVIVQHLSPDFKSLMHEILSRHTKMPVRRIEDQMPLQPRVVYLIPPNKDLILEDEKLILCERQFNQGVSQPIDRFFSSLGKARGAACAAVVFSGSGSDGSRGILDICEAGGMVLVEAPEKSRFDGMPRAAMETGLVDFAGSIPQIAVWISGFIESFVQSGKSSDVDVGQPANDTQTSGLQLIIELLRSEYNIDFTQYKPNMIVRRIQRRWQLMQFASIDEYVSCLENDPDELNRLYQDLLIGVTRFFRDYEAFDVLAKRVLPDLINQSCGRTLRVWSPGCATGEETYSLAIEISEAFEAAKVRPDVKIFATDTHRLSLERAAAGIYSAKELSGVPPQRLAKYFQRVGADFQVRPEIRKMIVFAPQNILFDASFTNIDLVVCRNMLIYFGEQGKRRALGLMDFGLRTGGYLFLGPSETPSKIQNHYETIDRKWRIYRKLGNSRTRIHNLHASDRRTLAATPPQPRRASTLLTDRLILNAIEGLAADYLPPTFVTDASFNLLYSTAGSADYLRRQEGRYRGTLPDLLLPALRTTVLIGLQRCAREKTLTHPIVVGQIIVPGEQIANAPRHSTKDNCSSSDPRTAARSVRVTIRRVEVSQDQETGFSVTLTDESAARLLEAEDHSHISAEFNLNAQATLEQELSDAKQSLQATIEELETSNEELQATNEEMVAANEELQCTNEELHSVNEELYTVNAEHQTKIEQLTELTEDMENLLRSASVATLFLDDEYRIRRVTPNAAHIFGLTQDDVGRPLENFSNPLKYDQLYEVIRAAVVDNRATEEEVLAKSGERFLLKVTPYKSSQHTAGAVLTLVSLQNLEAARQQLEMREARFRGTFENAAVGIAHVALDGQWLRVNQRLCDLVGYTLEELLASDFQSITHPDDLNDDLELFEQLKAGDISRYTIRKRYIHKQGHEVPIDLTVSLQHESEREAPYCISIIQDSTERANYQKRLEEAISQRDQFLAVLSHELRNPLGSLRNAIKLLQHTAPDLSKSSQLVDLLERQTQHMSRLVEDLLDTSRITQNRIVLQRELIDLSEVADESVASLRSNFAAKEQSLTLTLHGSEFPVIGDRTRLLQTIENLLANANRYTQCGGRIQVDLSIDSGFVVLSVADDGQGIAPEQIDSIFSMFTRGRETQETQGGLGIGLALAKMLVEKHEGRLIVHSDGVGQGATFTLHFPLAAIPKGMTMDAPQSTNDTSEKAFRVVLIEDDDDARITLASLLELDGHVIIAAANGREGIEQVLQSQPDFALVDLSMPEISGFDVARQLRESANCPATQLIALTGHGQPNDLQRTREAGFAAHLVKPIDTDALTRLMHKLTENNALLPATQKDHNT